VQADAVLAGAGAFQPQCARHQVVIELLRGDAFFRLVRIEQVAEVEVAVADVADQEVGNAACVGFRHRIEQAVRQP